MIPMTDRVQNHTGAKTVQPSSNSTVNAEGMRLRRRLSKIFHRQARPNVAPFQKIMAEDPILGKAPLECSPEGIDVIDSFADERAFTEQVLVHVGDGARIRVDPRLTSVESCIL